MIPKKRRRDYTAFWNHGFHRLRKKACYFEGDFRAAGYPSCEFPRGYVWREVHQWGRDSLRDGKGRQEYTWTGSVCWFATEDAKARFLGRFPPRSCT